jgi:penicillin-binding protein 2
VGSISPEQWEAEKETYRRNDLIGKTGIESSAEAVLRGSAGERLYEVDAHGRIMSLVGDRSANDGGDVQLSLDFRLQRAAEIALRKELDRLKLQRGAVIAMDPRDGSIRAIVSLPSYDNNAFSGSVSSTMYAALLKDESFPLCHVLGAERIRLARRLSL